MTPKKTNVFLFFLLFLQIVGRSSIEANGIPQKIEAVIFDCDGVLVDTEHLKFLAWQKALFEHGVDFLLDEYIPLAGCSSKNILNRINILKGVELPESVIYVKNLIYNDLQKKGVSPIQEAVLFVRQLSEARAELGIKLGLASAGSHKTISISLEQIGLENAFDAIVSGSDDLNAYQDAEGKNKPKPYIYIEIAKCLQVTPCNCIVFEDTSAGIDAAADAGMIAIAVPNRFILQQDFPKAYAIIDSFAELEASQLMNSVWHILKYQHLIPSADSAVYLNMNRFK